MSDPLNVLSLFSGIGGLELGLERAGMRVVGQVEIDPFCNRVLAKHWPKVDRHDDVRTAVDWWRSKPRPRVDVVAGGFPCQPVSLAGHGHAQADPRWLWPAMADVIADVRPRWVVWENVPGLLTRGLGIVHGDLVRLGYVHRVGWASACAVGAPHLRRRLLGVAHAEGERCGQRGWVERESEGAPQRHVHHWAAQPEPYRVVDGVPRRMDRNRGLGNAVVPQVGEYVGRLIVAAVTPIGVAA